MKDPTLEEALTQKQGVDRLSRLRVDSDDGSVWAQTKRGSTTEWNVYRTERKAFNKTARIGCLTTRNRDVVRAVLNALAPFREKDAL